MDYNKVKLGLIEKFKVWNQRRIAEAQREQYYKDTGELLEVDYSEAEKLKTDLLTRKRIKRATKDASRLYKKIYGRNNDGIGEADFIKDYLIENGLEQKALPEQRHNFMEKYPVEKSEEELAYEKATKQPRIYYKIDDVEYELPSNFVQYAVRMQDIYEKPLPLEEKENGKYILVDEQMNSSDKYEMLRKMMDLSLNYISVFISTDNEPSQELQNRFSRLCRTSSAKDYVAEKLSSENRLDDANNVLKKKIGEILQFRNDILKDEQEKIR